MIILLYKERREIKMKFYIDFTGYCEIEAKDEEEARQKFWDYVFDEKGLPNNFYIIDNIEEKEI